MSPFKSISQCIFINSVNAPMPTFRLFLFSLAGLFLIGCETGKNGGFASHSQVFNIMAYGAVNDSKVSSTDAFRRAIADCRKAGGGIVRVPAGHFLTGPIDMVDNMTLQIDRGAVVYFETGRAQYPDVTSRWEGLTENGPHPLIFANGLHNIAITGGGTFDGQGAVWWATMDMAEHGNARPNRPIRRRPMFVQIKDCKDVRIEGPTFVNSPFWNIHLLYSENIDVGHCRLIAPFDSPNTDGLNTDSCRHVLVHDCFADVGDDAFGVKSGRDEEGRKMNRPTEDVTYLRCHVLHGHSVCAIGSEESGGVRHVRFLDCTGDGTDNGIRIKSTRGRGGIVEDITASNFRLKNVHTAILLSLRYTKTPEEPLSERTPLFRDIHIDHVIARNSGNCCTIEGLEEQPIQNVTLNDLDLSGTNGVTCSFARNITFQNVRIAAQDNSFVEEHSEDIHRIGWHEVRFVPGPQ
jgi:polygalacturonase